MKDTRFKKGNQFAKGLTNSGVPKVYTKEYIESLIPDLEAWAKTDDAIIFNEWIVTRGFHQQRCSEFCQVSAEFAEVYKRAKQTVGMRRERKAMLGEFKNDSMIKMMAHVYDPEYFQSLITLKKAAQENQQPQQINVVLQGRAKPAKKRKKRKA